MELRRRIYDFARAAPRAFSIDWSLFLAALALSLIGLVTMYSFADESPFFERQILWISISVVAFFVASTIDYRFLRKMLPVALLYAAAVAALALVLVIGEVTLGAQSRFNLGFFSVQPGDIAKLVLIVVLAKYFARRHVEIARFKHILVSGAYAFVPFALLLLQPDLGSAIILGLIWFGMVLVAGISRTHVLAVVCIAAVVAIGMWSFVLEPYQKDRVLDFLHPSENLQDSGYSVNQSMIAVGSGQLFGKGIGYGTQSELKFLPEYETDFIFAAYAEEWGFVGVFFLFGLFGVIVWRVLAHATAGASNFETLFAVGVAVFLVSHFIVHVGINLGLMPVTGTTIPFMSYGGTHLLVEFTALGMLMGMRTYARAVRRDAREELITD